MLPVPVFIFYTEKKVNGAQQTKGSKKGNESSVAKRLKDEDVLTGKVKLKAYNLYFKSLGYVSSVILVLNFFLNQAVQTGKTKSLEKSLKQLFETYLSISNS